MKNSKAKKISVFAMMTALAFTLSFLESLLPFNFGVPGIKLGLANVVVVVAVYTMSPFEALAIALVRILLAGLTFGNFYSLAYSFAGGLLSFCIMLALKKSKLSQIGVSIAGAVTHNAGQLLVAGLIMHTSGVIFYFPVLLVAGAVTGFLTGVISKPVTDRLNKNKTASL